MALTPFKPGNTHGKKIGSRALVTEAFLRDFLDVWMTDGYEALKRVAQKDPSTFVRVASVLLPKETNVQHSLLERVQQMSDEQIVDRLKQLGFKHLPGQLIDGTIERPEPVAGSLPPADGTDRAH